MEIKNLNTKEAMDAIKNMPPKISFGYNDIRKPIFPEGRTDICVIQKDAEDGYSCGRTVLYVVYGDAGRIIVDVLYDTGFIHDNFHVWSVKINNNNLTVSIGYGSVKKILTYHLT